MVARSTLLALLLWPLAALAQFDSGPAVPDIKPQDVIFWDIAGHEIRQDFIDVLVRLRTERGFTLYQDKLKLIPPAGYVASLAMAPPARPHKDPLTQQLVPVFFGGEFTIRLTGPRPRPNDKLSLAIRYVGCTQVICLFPYEQLIEFTATNFVDEEGGGNTPPPSATTSIQPPLPPQNDDDATLSTWLAHMERGRVPLSLLVAVLVLGGLASNLSACVAPMLVVTLRTLRSSPTPGIHALLFGIGVAVVYTSLAVAATATGSLFGTVMSYPATNLVVAGVMAWLAVSLLGFGNWSFLQRLASLPALRVSPLREHTLSHARRAVLMGATAGFASAPCTGPILAALLVYLAKHHTTFEAALYMMIYSVSFAAPYVLLIGLAERLPSGLIPRSVRESMSVIFASIILALAFFYLRIPLSDVYSTFHNNWQEPATIATSGGILLMLAWITIAPVRRNRAVAILPATVLGFGLFATSQAVLSSVQQENAQALHWVKGESAALAKAKATQRPLLIDMWADWCIACKEMEVTTFRDPAVVKLLNEDWVAAKIDLTDANDTNDEIQQRYGLRGLPTLVLLPPDGDMSKKKLLAGYTSGKALIKHMRNYHWD